MAKGIKTGGRTAGTPNKRTLELVEKLDELGCDPVEGMARIAMDDNNTPDLRGRMYAELAQYIFPKRKAIEQTNINPAEMPSQEELDNMLAECLANNPALVAKVMPH